VLILAAVGQTLVVQQRGIDLSVPGFISLTVVLVTHLPNGNSSKLLPAILLAYAICLAAGLVNGLLVTRVGITPIVQTLGMNAVLYGIDLGISQGRQPRRPAPCSLSPAHRPPVSPCRW
jgi:Ribose/xylose/arabinose/galactoside ABC-type transport systems, permease components